jgi:regulatory protein
LRGGRGSGAGGSDPERDALLLLNRRPFTKAELRKRLQDRGHAAAALEEALSRLESQGWIDDRKLATHFLLARADRTRHGPKRLLADLARRGVPPAVAEEAWTELVERGDVDSATLAAAAARRRVAAAGGKLDRKRYAAVYNALFRAGFEPDTIRVALDPYRTAAGDPEEDSSETTDDLP